MEIIKMMDENQLSITERAFNSMIQCHIICGYGFSLFFMFFTRKLQCLYQQPFKVKRDR